MYNGDDFVKLMKKAAVEAMNAAKPCNIVSGKVLAVEPLKIKVDQKLILGEAQLVLCRNVTDYEVEMTADPLTESKKVFLVHNALKVDENVILVQVAGGQKYVVIDRIGKEG